MPDPGTTVTALLAAHREGDPAAFHSLVDLVYDQLRDLGHVQRRQSGPDGYRTTALVHELYLKLVDQRGGWRDRGHFFAACATAMRHILVDAARHRSRQKRGGKQDDLPLDEQRVAIAVEGDPDWLLRLDELMAELARLDDRMVRVFECRYFAGYTNQETADALGLGLRTAQRDWDRSRAWLRRALTSTGGDGATP